MAQYITRGAGALRSIAVEGTAFVHTPLANAAVDPPDVQLHFVPVCGV